MWHLRVLFILSVNTVIAGSAFSQYVDISDLPQYDCNTEKWAKFESKDFIIVTPNETDSLLENRVMVHSSWYDDSCLIKSERDMSTEDYGKNLWILGTIGEYEHWEKFGLPILKTKEGFIFNGIEFIDSLDGIGIVDTSRIAFVGNSNQTIFGLREPDLAYGFDFIITQKNKKTYFGNFVGDTVNWSSLVWLRESNYLKYDYDYINFYVSCRFEYSLDLDSVYFVLKSFADDFTKMFEIEIPANGPLAYIHQDHSEIANMTAFWDGACWGHIYGFQVWDEIHTEGFGFDLIKHEFGHHVFNSNFEDFMPTIIREGVIEYYFNELDSSRKNSNLSLAKVYADSLNFVDFISDRKSLFGLGKFEGKDIGYGVSGIFVNYILDVYGLNRFKNFCNQKDPLDSINSIFGNTPQGFIVDFKKWIDKQHNSPDTIVNSKQ
jgi:hypothetical protein